MSTVDERKLDTQLERQFRALDWHRFDNVFEPLVATIVFLAQAEKGMPTRKPRCRSQKLKRGFTFAALTQGVPMLAQKRRSRTCGDGLAMTLSNGQVSRCKFPQLFDGLAVRKSTNLHCQLSRSILCWITFPMPSFR